MNKQSLVLLSGGFDSTTCLFWAKKHLGGNLHAITYDYGQRNVVEMSAARKVAKLAGCQTHELLLMGANVLHSTSPLVSDNPVGQYESVAAQPVGVDAAFVPCRNILFLTIAANRAVALGVRKLIFGSCLAGYGGFPDSRPEFVHAMERAINQGLYGFDHTLDGVEILTPLAMLDKRQSVVLAAGLPGCMEALAYSHTCYNGQYPPNPHNHASLGRAKGFADAGVPDPLIMRAKAEGLLPADYPDHGLVAGTKYALAK